MADFDTPRDVVDPERPLETEPPQVGDETPEADALEQQTGVLPDDEAAQAEPLEFDPELEANPADVDEQRRVVPLPDDESPLSEE
jgi:hypothetical protein